MTGKGGADGDAGFKGLLRGAAIYALLASIWISLAHFAIDLARGDVPLGDRYEVLADTVVAIPITLLIFFLFRREMLARVRLEAARKTTERRLAHTLEAAAEGIVLVDQNDRIVLLNRGAERTFGYGTEEVRGQHVEVLLPGGVSGLRSPPIQPSLPPSPPESGHGAQMEVTGRRRDGTLFPAEATASELVEDGQKTFTLFLHDISRRKAAEEALLRSHQQLEERVQERTRELGEERNKLTRILDAMPDGIMVVGENNRVDYANPALERDFGPAAGRNCYDYLQEQRDNCGQCPPTEGRNGRVVQTEWRSGKNGKTYERILAPMTGPGGPAARLEILHDISKRLVAEKERERLRAEIDSHRQLFQTIVDNATVAIAVFQGEQLRLKWANPSYRKILDEQLQDVDIRGLRLEEMLPSAAESGVVEVFRRVATTRVPHFDAEFRFEGFNRGVTYWQWSLLPLPGEQDPPDLMVLAAEITENTLARRRIEELGGEAERRAGELHRAYTELQARTRELTALLTLSQQVTSTLELKPLLQLILDLLKGVFVYSGAAILVPEGDGMTVLANRGVLPEEQAPELAEVLKERLSFQAAIESGEPGIIYDLWADEKLRKASPEVDGAAAAGVAGLSASWLGIPMLVKGRVVGLLRLDRKDPGYFTTRHAQVALAIAHQAAIALENARLYRAARKGAVLEERQRLARELHDSVSQALYGIALGAHTALEVVDQDPARLMESLQYILKLADSAVAEMRFLIFELRPEFLEREGLTAAIGRLADAVQHRSALNLRLAVCLETDLHFDLKETLYRVCREALWNTAKHSGAGTVTVRLHQSQGQIVLEVEDDGCGFDPAGPFPGHMGLQSMRERVAKVGGTLEIASSASRGTCVRASVPQAVTLPSPVAAGVGFSAAY